MRTLIAFVILALLGLSTFFGVRTLGSEASQPLPADGVYPRPEELRGVETADARPDAFGLAAGRNAVGRQPGSSSEVAANLQVAADEGPALEHSLTGYMYDDLGTPLFYFKMEALDGSRAQLEPNQIEPDGTFLLLGLAAGRRRLMIGAPGHESRVVELNVPFEGELKLTLSRVAVISGTVISETGAPVALARVVRRGAGIDKAAQRLEVTTDHTGRFELEAPRGTVQVEVEAFGYLPEPAIVLELVPGQRFTGLIVQLETGGVIEGVVQPLLAGQMPQYVQVLREGHQLASRSSFSITDDGRFRATGLESGRYTLTVHATRAEVRALLGDEFENGASLLRRDLTTEVVEGQTAHVEFEARAYQPVRVGGIVMLNGELVHEGRITARNDDPDHPRSLEVSATFDLDAPGAFALTALPGTWRFTLENALSSDRIRISFVEEIRPGPEHRIDLFLETGSISGTVRDRSGNTVSEVLLTLQGGDGQLQLTGTAFLNSSGAFHLGALPAGEYTLHVRGIDWDQVDPTGDIETTHLKLQQPAAIRVVPGEVSIIDLLLD